jgi:hypothetical protein
MPDRWQSKWSLEGGPCNQISCIGGDFWERELRSEALSWLELKQDRWLT